MKLTDESYHRPPEEAQRATCAHRNHSYYYLFLLLSVAFTCSLARVTDAQQQLNRLPDLSGTSDEPVEVSLGSDAFLSCRAVNLQNYTLVWRYSSAGSSDQSSTGAAEEQGRILTAGLQRVTSDRRFSVIRSHDTWLLKISQVDLNDAGSYVCHTNSEPRIRAIRILSVISPHQSQNPADKLADLRENLFNGMDYDFTDCCRSDGVTDMCLRLCSLQQMASTYQSIHLVHDCYSSIPTIGRCMVGGRNVSDCCHQRHIPDRCLNMCGHHSAGSSSADSSQITVQDQSYCADYAPTIISCVAQGLSDLPGQPELVVVEAVSSDTLQVSWQKAHNDEELRKIDGFIINLTKLSSFEDTIATNIWTNKSSQLTVAPPLTNLTVVDVTNNASLASMTKLLAASSGTLSLKLDKHLTEFAINNLKPYTVYQIQMFAYNSLGKSQVTDPIRALTLAPETSELSAAGHTQVAPEGYEQPQLPDTRKCCRDAGITLNRCLDTLCDPVQADKANISDLMICAPWSNITFGCLSSRVDHSQCCMARGVTPFCQSICSGEVKRFDYRHFRCLAHMGTYTNCILEKHDVLPSAPQNFTVSPITHSWAVLNWRAPRKHATTVQGYRIFWRQVGETSMSPTQEVSLAKDDSAWIYQSSDAATNPYLLDGLLAETVYEVYVVAVNKFGESMPSSRFIFQTLVDPDKVAREQLSTAAQATGVESRLPLHENSQGQIQGYFNETSCCANSGVRQHCLNLCDYDLKVEDVSQLVGICNSQMPVVLRCLAGSRNSVPCCRNRGVSDGCLNVCAGLSEHSPLVVATRCSKDFGKIITCMDEGSKLIPGAPIDLKVTDIGPDRVALSWLPAPEDALRANTEYHVRYQQLQQVIEQPSTGGADLSSLIAVVPLHPLEHIIVNSTKKTEFTIDKLKPNSRYSIYVTAENANGISLPSLVLVIQTPAEGESASEEHKRNATLGAPHQVEIKRIETDSLLLKWLAPLFVPNEAHIRYRIFYKQTSAPSLASNSATTEVPMSSTATGLDTTSLQQSTNWTLIETQETTALLRNLQYSSQYAITVQAYSKNLLGHMSEILIASTAKPVPPV